MPEVGSPSEVVIEGLQKSFGRKAVLRGVDLVVGRGEMVAIVGGSGSGKTVLLKHVTAHFQPDAGRVLVADHESDPGPAPDYAAPLLDLARIDESVMDRLRMHWAVVFQRNALLTGSVLRNLSVELREVKGLSDEQIRPLAIEALLDVGLDPELVLDRERDALSGGMAKRVAVARALVMDPVLVLYDEPTSGLDPEMCRQIHDLIRTTHEAQPRFAVERAGAVRTSIVVTHDTELLRRLKPRIVMLGDGVVCFDGTYEAFTGSRDERIEPYLRQMGVLHDRS
jgi:phospholipid/cholesterol/gamma-HCH transport system ATP-binding protein